MYWLYWFLTCLLVVLVFSQALLLNEEDRGFCGGTILNNYLILTAAHCMNQSRYIYVVLGTANHTLPAPQC